MRTYDFKTWIVTNVSLFKAHLASVTKEEENGQLVSLANGGSFWVGGKRIGDTGAWSWTDGVTWSYSAWAPGEPANLGDKCVEVGFIGHDRDQWNDQDCWRTREFVCKKQQA